MFKRTHIKLLSLLIVLSLILTSIPGSAVNADAVNAEAAESSTFQLDADCQILDYVHEDVFNGNDHIARLKEEETLDTYVFLNRDGTKTVYYMNDAVKYRDASGTIREKNIDLTAGINGYSTTQNDVQLHIPNNITNGVQLSYAGYDVSIVPQGGSSKLSPQRNGNSVAYPNYFGSGTALVYTPTLDGVKEDILLAKYNGISNFTFLLNTDGLNLYHTPEDRYYLALTEDSQMQIWLGNIEIFDAEAKPSMGTLTVETVTAGQQYRLTVSADVDFLTDPDTVYPVTIDPTITVWDNTYGVNAIEDAPIFEGYPTSNFGTYQYDRAGYVGSPYGKGRTVVRLNGLVNDTNYAAVSAEDIQNVKFYIADASGTSSTTVYLHELVDVYWTESDVTWNSVGSYGNYRSGASVGNNGYASFDITSLAKAWKGEGYNDGYFGFILVGAYESSIDRALYSSEHSTSNMRPYVIATYTYSSSMPTSIDIDIGSSKQLTATGMSGTITWTSSDPSVATVNSAGFVTGAGIGEATITASAPNYTPKTCTVYVTIADGVYYIKNVSSGKYLAVDGGGLSDQTAVTQEEKTTEDPDRLSQLWKIKYLDEGYYSIRPMHKLDMGLNYDVGGINITSIGTIDSLLAITYDNRWKIGYETNGCVFMANGSQSWTLYPSGGSSAAGTSIVGRTYSSSNTAFQWTLERITNIPDQIHIYNTETGSAEDNTVHTIRPGQTLTLADLGIGVGVTSSNSNDQSITWSSDDTQIASVNSSTGTVTAGSAKCRATTITATSSLGVSTQYIICVTPVTLEAQQTEYWCWVASARMFTENYTTVDDEDTQAKVASDLGLFDNENGGTTIDISNAIREFSNGSLTEENIGKTTDQTKWMVLTKTALISALDEGNVVCIGIEYTSTGIKHALLIVAHHETSDGDLFVLFDPGPCSVGSIHVVSYETICSGSFTENGSHVWSSVVAVRTIFDDLSDWVDNFPS